MTLLPFYYAVKACLPKPVELRVRQILARRKLRRVADVWPILESAGTPPLGWKGWPDGKQFAFVISHDVDTKRGLDHCLQVAEIEERLGFRSCFYFVPEGRYAVSPALRKELLSRGFEVGVHGLRHDWRSFTSRRVFEQRAPRINQYIEDWNAVGFRAPSMIGNLEWIRELNVEYDASTFDTDPFEPQPDGAGTIFPFQVDGARSQRGYVELPYTLPQDFTLFVLLAEKGIGTWKRKLDWIVTKGGMVFADVHPDYMASQGDRVTRQDYPMASYEEFLAYVATAHKDRYWHALPRDVARFWRSRSGCDAGAQSAGPGAPPPAPPHGIPAVAAGRLKTQNGHAAPAKTALRDDRPLAAEQPRTPKRVCMLAYAFYDTDNRIIRYADTLVERGDMVDVIALRRKDQPTRSSVCGVSVFRIQRRERNESNRFSYLARMLCFCVHSSLVLSIRHLRSRYDLVHVHSVPDFAVFTTWFVKLLGARVILDIHDIVPEFYLSKFRARRESRAFRMLVWMERVSCAFADHIIIANDIWLKTLTSRSAPPSRCSVFVNYASPIVFSRKPRTRSDHRLVMMYHGGLQWHQGLDIAIRSFARIRDRAPTAEFHIYGEGSEKSPLQALTTQLGIQNCVLFHDFVPLREIPRIIANADVGVVAKRADGFGNEAYSTKILEYMSQGIPVVVPKTKVDSLYFEDSVVAFFRPGDEADLADTMLSLLLDPERRRRLGENALKYFGQNNWSVKSRDYLDLVDSLSARGIERGV